MSQRTKGRSFVVSKFEFVGFSARRVKLLLTVVLGCLGGGVPRDFRLQLERDPFFMKGDAYFASVR